MKSSFRTLSSAGLVALACIAGTAVLHAGEVSKSSIRADDKTPQNQLQAMAKISMADAIKAAVAAVPGEVIKSELEAEDGGLSYSIEIRGTDKVVTEVEVDAGNGKILDTDREDAKDKKY